MGAVVGGIDSGVPSLYCRPEMGWYDVFSCFYDQTLTSLYADARREACLALDPQPNDTVLDLPCGTGQSFDVLAPALADGGHLVGVDLSDGMLRRAKERIARNGWTHVQAIQADVLSLERANLETVAPRVDALHVFLGLSAFPDWENAFRHAWDLLVPGGRCVVVDVYSASPGVQGHMVNAVARADIRRRFWEPLENVAEDYSRCELPSLPGHGGQLYLARGRKPARSATATGS